MERRSTAHFEGTDRHFETMGGTRHDYMDGSGPYEYLMGALAGCFYSTLEDYERNGTWDSVEITASGIKRTTVPTTLETTRIELVVRNCSDKEEFAELVKKTCSTCSIYNTISCVSEMEVAVRFEDDEE